VGSGRGVGRLGPLPGREVEDEPRSLAGVALDEDPTAVLLDDLTWELWREVGL